ncbi:Filament-like plant protein [Melia azedarach]|uniref:Filament-like plant protein n=1 Tax=Melia azedarach TaxID=155640 RepID=A0ACC1WNR3_MELAZ|nr:Filament-like plant protein [Melia azedarach]
MEKRKWLWKRKASERSPGETESSGSISSHSERYSDDQEVLKASPNGNAQSPEVTSKAVANGEDINDNVRTLTEKLSAALVNVSAKEDLVKQHAKVAEEAIAGWEKAENEVVILKQKLEASVQQNSTLEDRVSHLDGALKECVRQLRQARDEQEQKIREAVEKRTREWESIKLEFENQLLELRNKAETVKSEPQVVIDPDLCQKLEFLEKENSALKMELLSQSEELEIRAIERDLSTQVAETASKQHLESIKKVAKLEAECRRLKAMTCRASSPLNDHKSTAASSICVESLVDSQSDSGERLNTVEIDNRKRGETSCSDSWASALIAELDQFKNDKAVNRNIQPSSTDIDLMDDFLEMERLASLPNNGSGNHVESEAFTEQSIHAESSLRAELEAMIHRTDELEDKFGKMNEEKAELEDKMEKMEAENAELEEKIERMEAEKAELQAKIEKMEAEKAELEIALTKSQDSIEALQLQLREAEMKLEELQKELNLANESRQLVESKVSSTKAEAEKMSAQINLLEEEVGKERAVSAQITVKCQKLEEELWRTKQEIELQQIAESNSEKKIKQEDLETAAGKLAECQKTIASLGKQLKSLATLEDFLIDTGSIPELSRGTLSIPKPGGEPWKLHSNETFSPKRHLNSPSIAAESTGPSMSKKEGHTPPSASSSTSSSAVSSNHVNPEKNRNGFAKFFSRTKNGIQLEL